MSSSAARFHPGADDVGALTNNGTLHVWRRRQYLFDMEDAIGQEGTNWDLLAASGVLDIEATNTESVRDPASFD